MKGVNRNASPLGKLMIMDTVQPKLSAKFCENHRFSLKFADSIHKDYQKQRNKGVSLHEIGFVCLFVLMLYIVVNTSMASQSFWDVFLFSWI